MTSRPLLIPGQLTFDDPVLQGLAVAAEEPATAAEELVEVEVEAELIVGADAMVETLVDEHEAPNPTPLAVEVIRSTRRTKTAQARLVGSTVEIRIPARCSSEEERELVDHFTTKFERSRSTDSIDLAVRARRLAERYRLPMPESIRWVSNQRYRWGSCTPSQSTIRLSDQLAEFPSWVIDYVIVHELAHLVESGHDAAFWSLVEAYPLTERARGFLIAKGIED